MYDLVEEASKVLRNPTTEFDFENPPEDPKEIEKNLNCNSKKNYLPMQKGDVKETWANCDLLEDLTGFIPKTNIEKGIKNFCDWYKDYYL